MGASSGFSAQTVAVLAALCSALAPAGRGVVARVLS
jgi:hypothetical protein